MKHRQTPFDKLRAGGDAEKELGGESGREGEWEKKLMYQSIEVSTYISNTWNLEPETRNLRRGSAERI